MINVLNVLGKILTFLTFLFCLGLTAWSVTSSQPFILSLVGMLLAGGFGYFSFMDVKKLLSK